MVHHPKHIDEHPRKGKKLCDLADFELWKNRYIALHLLKLPFALGRFKFNRVPMNAKSFWDGCR
jgi:hypothetical protein